MRDNETAAVVCGAGSWLPPRRVTNADLAGYLDTSDEWIVSRTGIHRRHVVDAGTSTGDLAVEAGREALKSAGDTQVDAVVLATTTPDRLCPATAPEVATRLGLTGVAAYDVSAVCTGFVYALASATGLIAAGVAERVLVIGAEAFTTILNPRDRTTVPIFADGAGALVLRAGTPDEPGAVRAFDLGSDGENSDLIQIPAGGSRQRSAGTPAGPGDGYFTMRGRDVYRHAVERMAASVRRVMDRAGWRLSDVDRLVPHQANSRISTAVAARLDIPDERCLSNIAEVGNTAAASVPLLLAQGSRQGWLRPGHRVLLTAFGGGLTWGSAALTWPELDIQGD
ncbi:MAG: ketoacyl-ACP synthase III [Actinobacteria bacterium]|nr:MAG: ketoacyl-ACP synthase III [Actinomycetota bacterium]